MSVRLWIFSSHKLIKTVSFIYLLCIECFSAVENVRKRLKNTKDDLLLRLERCHPVKSRIQSWTRDELRRAEAEFIEECQWSAHEEALLLCSNHHLSQTVYFLNRDLTFMKEVGHIYSLKLFLSGDLWLITARLVTGGTITARIKSRGHIALRLCTTWLLCIRKTTRPNSNLSLLTNSVSYTAAILQPRGALIVWPQPCCT